ncbi:MAG TPA: hypothetical protein EYH03_06245, partial [Chromatiales bacterium]|nr:hypothetical protein [Chromatiales bacterium]
MNPRVGKTTGIRPGRERGISLIELMIAMMLSLLLAVGITNLFIGTKQTYQTGEALSRLQENARYAMNRIFEDLTATGYMGCMPSAGNITNVLANQTGGYDFTFALAGVNGTQDQITIRRAVGGERIPLIAPMTDGNADIQLDSSDPDYARLEQYDVVTISDCSHAAVFMITNDPTASGGAIQHITGVTAPASNKNAGQSNNTSFLSQIGFGKEYESVASLIRTVAHTYSIGTSTAGSAAGSTCAADSRYCALLRDNTELVEGVENMQILFGIDADGDRSAERYVDANGVSDWDQVISVRMILTLNSVEPLPGSGLMTRTFTNTFRVRNR